MKRVLIFLLLIFFLSTFSLFPSALRVYYVNVGQGDCIYISFPDGKNMLIDGGVSLTEDIRNPVIVFLRAKEITRINYMLVSHPHSDHINGLYAVLKMFNVEKIYDTGVNNPGITIDEKFRELAKSIPGRYIIVNSTGPLPGFYVQFVTCTVLYTDINAQRDLNNNSIVIRIQYRGSTFLFGGDATGNVVERRLVEWHGNTIQSDCYKVHHHGSKGSSFGNFLSALQPKYAFIQVGRNPHGHPAPDAINRIAEYTGLTNIYRNDHHGTIFVKTTGDGKYSIQTGYIPVPDVQEPEPGRPPQPGAPAPLVKSEFILVELSNNVFCPEQGEYTYLTYTMTTPGKIYVNIYTLFGELVRSDEFYENRQGLMLESAPQGEIKWRWDGRNQNNQPVAPGVYLVHIQTPIKSEIKKAVVVR